MIHFYLLLMDFAEKLEALLKISRRCVKIKPSWRYVKGCRSCALQRWFKNILCLSPATSCPPQHITFHHLLISDSDAETVCVRLLFRLFAPLHPVTVACRIACTSRLILLLKMVLLSDFFPELVRGLFWSFVHADSHSYLLTSIYCTYTSSLSDYLTKYILKSTWA